MYEKLNQEELENLIILYNEKYRMGSPLVRDMEYDETIKYLAERFPNSQLLKKSIIESGGKDPLPVNMMSLYKVHSIKEIKDWLWRTLQLPSTTIVTLSPKYDGLAILSDDYYKNRWKRGNGIIGTKITNHFQHIVDPLNSKWHIGIKPRLGYFIGEGIISKDNFNKYKDIWKTQEGEPYANPRNAVASFFNTTEPEVNKLKHVRFLKYGIEGLGLSKSEQFDYCNIYNFNQVPYKKIQAQHITEEMLDELYYLWGEEFEIDGIVIDIDDTELRKNAGYRTDGDPNYAIAYKANWEETGDSEVLGIKLQISRHGKVTPVATIKPTILEGGEVTSVTLYNAQYMVNKGISVGSLIQLRRSGGVIPQILKVYNPDLLTKEMVFQYFRVKLNKRIVWSDDEPDIYLVDLTKEQEVLQIEHFFTTIGVENFKVKGIEAFYDAGFNSIFKIVEVIKNSIRLSTPTIKGFAERSWDDLYNQLIKSLQGISEAKLQAASGLFHGIGESTLKEIMFEVDVNYLEKDSYFNEITKKLLAIEGFGDITTKNYLYNLPDFVEFQIRLSHIINISVLSNKVVESSGDLKGEIFVFSGFRDNKLKAKIEALGGKVSSSVSLSTTFVLCKDINSTSSKVVEAKNNPNITVKSVNDFKIN